MYTGRRIWVRLGLASDEGTRVDATSAGLHTGQQMENFELPDEKGRPFELYQRLRQGPLVLVFYRGDW
jgi:hypothetical protein